MGGVCVCVWEGGGGGKNAALTHHHTIKSY